MKRERGFTLIELMIALVVLAILVAIAYPSYTNQVVKSRRADGIAALNRAVMEMESCRSDNDGSYLNCETIRNIHNRISEDGFYLITAPASATATAYSFEAAPQGVQATKDKLCTKLTVNSLGVRGFTGSAPGADTCWGQ
jgi:type IV pilus assembly protein PilE